MFGLTLEKYLYLLGVSPEMPFVEIRSGKHGPVLCGWFIPYDIAKDAKVQKHLQDTDFKVFNRDGKLTIAVYEN